MTNTMRLLAGLWLAAVSTFAAAQTWPGKPVRLILSSAPGLPPADGYTFCITTNDSLSVNPHLYMEWLRATDGLDVVHVPFNAPAFRAATMDVLTLSPGSGNVAEMRSFLVKDRAAGAELVRVAKVKLD